MKTTPPNWIPLADPITEAEVKLELSWTADPRTARAIERQAACMRFESPQAYLGQILAAVLASNEGDTVVLANGKLACRHEVAN
jgi:hypothetical protein